MMTGAAPAFDNEQYARAVQAIASEAKPLVDIAAEPGVEDVVVNPGGRVWVKRTGQGWSRQGEYSPLLVQTFLSRLAFLRGARFDYSNPIIETDFPDGSRVTGVLPPIVREPMVAIRPFTKSVPTLDDYVSSGILTRKGDPQNRKRTKSDFLEKARGMDHEAILRLAIENYLNIVVVGSTGSGKTTASNMVAGEIGRISPGDRVVSIEDTRELKLDGIPNYVSLLSATERGMDRCLKLALRLTPSRIAVGEVRDEAAKTLLTAWNTGHSGGFCTVHADDAYEALQRIEMITPIPDIKRLRYVIAKAINLIVFIDADRDVSAGRKVREILLIRGYDAQKDEYDCAEL